MGDVLARLHALLSDRYLVEREVAQGGMATVYLARDLKHGRPVALKVLRPELSALLGTERFLAEIELTANLRHPHILPLHDSGAADGLLYYVMPFVTGESLRSKLARERQLSVADAVEITVQVATALQYAHTQGLIHRDIKPENILLEAGQAVVTDFGIALAVRTAGGARLTETGLSPGTPQYMSPEQAAGDRELDARSDVYSLACVTYEMLAGDPPLAASTVQAMMTKVMTETPRSLAEIRRTVPPDVSAAVAQALEKLPADRFASASDFATALQTGADSRAPRVVARSTRRARSWLLMGGTLVAVAAAAFWLGTRATGSAELPTRWVGEKLGGSPVALDPRVSPDGKSLAFQAMIDGMTQVGVLTMSSGSWKVRTSDLTKGLVQDFAWSRDGAQLYFGRYFDTRQVFRISPVEGDERPVLEQAFAPQVLPDNSLLLGRFNADGIEQLHRYTPEGGASPLGAVQSSATIFPALPFRVFADGREAVFYGRPANDSTARDHLYTIDLESGRVRSLAPTLTLAPANWRFPLAVSADDQWVLFDLPSGDLHQIVAVPRDGSDRLRSLIPLTAAPLGLDVDGEGNIYVDQPAQRIEIYRYFPARAVLLRHRVGEVGSVFPLSDGRFLLWERYTGRQRIAVLTPGKPPEPFVVGSSEETNWPVTMLGTDRVALRIGSKGSMSVAIVSIATGGIIGRLTAIPAEDVQSLSGSPDGDRLYYARAGFIWEARLDGSPPHQLCAGTSVAVSPIGNEIVVQRTKSNGSHLVRIKLTEGAQEEPIEIRDTLRLTTWPLAPNAVGPDGRIAVRIAGPGSWHYPAAILDPRTGRMELIEPGFVADAGDPGWASDGSVVSMGGTIQSNLWRFRPVR